MSELNFKNILKCVSIEGFRSFKSLQDFEFRSINILIGANGSGKSNFIDFISWISDTARRTLNQKERTAGRNGIWDHTAIVCFTGKESVQKVIFRLKCESINYTMTFYKNHVKSPFYSIENKSYKSSIRPVNENSYVNDEIIFFRTKNSIPVDGRDAKKFFHLLADINVYHFYQIRETLIKNSTESIQPAVKLSRDGSNIAFFLLHLKENHTSCYEKIMQRIRKHAPFLEDFVFTPVDWGDSNDIQLNWKHINVADAFHPCQLSDGTLRFICLVAALLQPDPPIAIVIDEPELGLHPDAVHILAETIRDAADKTQVVIATHSPLLVDRFEPEDIIVADRRDGATSLTRFTSEYLKPWLEDYTLGELWRKNYLEGGARYE